ncbi:MAG: KH domain-containing protein [Collinsella intestinalis]
MGRRGRADSDITAPDLAVLIGRHGRTLESLQTIVSLLVSRVWLVIGFH